MIIIALKTHYELFYAIKNIFKGDVFTINNISLKRPGYGLHPKNFKKLLGKKSPFNYKIDQQIKI